MNLDDLMNLSDPSEQWSDIAGYEGYYQVSNLGRVRSCDRYVKGRWGKTYIHGKLLRPGFGKEGITPTGKVNGYCNVVLHKEGKAKFIEVHRLVAVAFVPNPENLPVVNHKDGVKYHNEASNLEWVTPSENSKHAIETGLHITDAETCRKAGRCAKPILSKPVRCVTTDQIYASRRDAANSLGIPESSVFDSLRDGRPHRGFMFEEILHVE